MTGTEEKEAQAQLCRVVNGMRERIEPFLPPGVTFEAVRSAALLSALRTPQLYGCSSKSLLIALVQAVQTGLTIGRSVFLVPFKGQAQMVVAYQGFVELALATGRVRNVFAHVVREGEPFEVWAGTEPKIVHRQMFESDRRPIVGAYAVALFPSGAMTVEVMSKEAIEKIRKEYSQKWGQGELPAWYARKTPVRQLAKYLPQTQGLYLAMRYEADPDLLLTPAQADRDRMTGLVSGPAEEPSGGDLAPAGVHPGRITPAVRLVLPPDARVQPLEDPARHNAGMPKPIPSVADLTRVGPVAIERPRAATAVRSAPTPAGAPRPGRPPVSAAPAAWSAPVQTPTPHTVLEADDGVPY